MPHPFIQHPSFGEYISHVIDQGCSVSKITDQETGLELTKIETEDDKRVISALSLDEILSLNTIRNFDLRLGIQSNWFQFTQHLNYTSNNTGDKNE